MGTFSRFVRRHLEEWKSDAVAQGDFRPSLSILKMSAMAVPIGIFSAVIAWILYHLIGLVTHIAFAGEWNFGFVQPSKLHPVWWVILIAPLVGGLIVGFMARYGSERIRGHGIPEALEAILFKRSKMLAKVAILKPLSSAVAIGTGGAFGAEGPIIMTAGAVGSLFGQFFKLTSMERRTLLVAGACAGMAATFETPIAATVLAIELMLFELRPRSTVPVGIACFVAAALRPALIGPGPLFPLDIVYHVSMADLGMAIIAGLLAALLSMFLTEAVYWVEDHFQKLPIHWMWWPVIGALAVGIGGIVEPRALGVGYDVIDEIVSGRIVGIAVLIFMIAKAFMWVVYLGSGTSGGVLAPLLALGAGLGALEGLVFPAPHLLWPLLGMCAVLAGMMRAPFTSIFFALELTHDASALPALLVACIVAYGASVFLMKRSILTEKVARRGFQIFREYSINRLEITPVKDVMTTEMVTIPGDLSLREAGERYFGLDQKYRAYPVVDGSGAVLGILTRDDLQKYRAADPGDGTAKLAGMLGPEPVVAFPNDSCQRVAQRAVQEMFDRVAVVEPGSRKLLGMVARFDLLKPYTQDYEDELLHERVLHVFHGRWHFR